MPKKILIIDDDPSCIKILEYRLRSNDYDVIVCRNGEEGLKKIRENKPDLVITDILLPKIDGFQVCAVLKDDPKLKHIPIVILTAIYVTEEDVKKGFTLGANMYFVKPDILMSKPVQADILMEHIHVLLGEKKLEEAILKPKDKILVVDDDIKNLKLLQFRLKSDDYEVFTAQDGEEGVKVFEKEEDVNLVLLDIQMPKMGGIEALTKIKSLNKEVAVVMMTGYGSEQIAVEAMKKGANDYLVKPINYKEISGVIHENIEKNKLKVAQVRLTEQIKETSQDLMRRIDQLEKVNALLKEQNEKIKELDRRKSEFLSRMSHELRTPMNSILGFSKLLLNKMDGEINEKQRTDIQAIYDSGNYLLELINEILDLARIESGKMEFQLEEFDVSLVIDEVVLISEPLIKGKNVELKHKFNDKPSYVYADRKRVRQILLNLLSNAIKYTEQGYVNVETLNNDSDVQIVVTDTGIGISHEDIPKVFEEFLRIDNQITRQTTGTGLGMAITKKLIEAQGGKIWIESELQKGTKVYFTLPFVKK
jgi:signal transduction histidine kinase